MTGQSDSDSTEGLATIAELVQRRLSNDDRWNLAVVQRAEVWNELRMRQLLDSLLADYPVGSILLSRVRSGASVELRVEGDGSRSESTSATGAWQVLDGQQRMNALFSIFTDQGNYGHFLLDMTQRRPEPSPAQSRRAQERALPHVLHLDDLVDRNEEQSCWLNLSGWAAWAAGQPGNTQERVTPENISMILSEIDNECDAVFEPEVAAIVVENFRRLWRAWHKQVPVLRAELDSPLDVLEVFTRVNLGGVNIAGVDVFMAGVKTFWPAAERRIDAFMHDAPLFTHRIDALRFLVRVVNSGLGFGDALPLTVERLTGVQGDLLLAALDEATGEDSTIRDRVRAFTRWFRTESELGFVISLVQSEIWDTMLAWAATSSRSDLEWYRENLHALDTYVLGSTLFGYHVILGDGFHRTALSEAMRAGAEGENFPLRAIVGVTRGRTELRGARGAQVLALAGSEDVARLARRGRNGRILTALAQRIPLEWEPEDEFDWDHIFPANQASRMWVLDERTKRRRHHPDRHLVNTTGNFWALTSSANRSLQDLPPVEKFPRLLQWMTSDSGHRVWGKERWAITPTEMEAFIEVDRLLIDDPESIDLAMRRFREVVDQRSIRLCDEVLARFPETRLFAFDPAGDRVDRSAGRQTYQRELGLHTKDTSLLTASRDRARDELIARRDSLHTQILEALSAAGRRGDDWLWANGPQAKAQTVYSCHRPGGGHCIELMCEWTKQDGVVLKVKAYPKRGRPNTSQHFPEFSNRLLGVQWADSDEHIVEAFIGELRALEGAYPISTTERR